MGSPNRKSKLGSTLTRRGVTTSDDGSRIGAGARSGSSLSGDFSIPISRCFPRAPATYHRFVDRLRERRDRLAIRRLDLVLAATAAGLILLTFAFLSDPSLSFALLDRSTDVAINSLTLLAAASLAALALARYRESGRLAGLYQSSAFFMLGWLALVNVAIIVLKAETRLGLSLGGEPEQLPIYVTAILRLTAGAILVVGGAAALNVIHRSPRVRRTLLAPVVAISVITIVLYLVRVQVTNRSRTSSPISTACCRRLSGRTASST